MCDLVSDSEYDDNDCFQVSQPWIIGGHRVCLFIT